MRKLLAALVAGAAATLALAGLAAASHTGRPVTDGPPGTEMTSPLFDAGGLSHVEPYRGSTGGDRGRRGADDQDSVKLVGALRLDPFDAEAHGDVAVYKRLAFIGKWRGVCPGTGVDIIDVSNPRKPKKIADTLDYADTSMEDMQAFRIQRRVFLAIGLQDCGNSATAGTVGLELYDITNPRNPQFLSLFNGADYPPIFATPTDEAHGHVHELDVAKLPDGRTVAALASPDSEAITSNAAGFNGVGDLILVDVSDPANPTFLAEYGVLDDPMFGVPFYLGVLQGGDARTLLHSPRFNADGTRVYLSYWDAGVIVVDISDPEDPTVLGRTAYALGEEGNAHSTDTANREELLVQADEDFSPFELQFTSSAFAGLRDAFEGVFTAPIVTLPGRAMQGEVVHVGRGCPADAALGLPVADPYLADPAGKIALIERGLCRFDNKIARAQLAGAIGAIVYNNAANGETPFLMGGENPVLQGSPDVIGTTITIPGISVVRSTGLLLAGGTPPVTARAAAVFNGWGYLRFFDISDPANPVQLSTFATANTNNEAVALDGTWSVHNPEVLRNNDHGKKKKDKIVYASWYSDGVRVLDIESPSSPREIASWTGQGAPAGAPPVNIWSVVPHRGLLYASDRDFGLYILKHRGDD
jgi:hypothetical protein